MTPDDRGRRSGQFGPPDQSNGASGRAGRTRSSGRGRRNPRGYRGAARPGRNRRPTGRAGGSSDHRRDGPAAPDLPADITGLELAPEVRKELSSLPKERADLVAKHLVAAGQLVDEDPEAAYQHAAAARARAARLGVVREALAITAYYTGRYAEALKEFRALRRLTGSNEYWPAMADCERGLGRPRRAIDMAGAPEAQTLDPAGRAELRLVTAGARRDLGQYEAALVTLRVPELADVVRPWSARLRYAYADTLLEMGDREGAKEWFLRATDVDPDDETGAVERLAELDGID